MHSADNYQAKYLIVFLLSTVDKKELMRQWEFKLFLFLAETQLTVAGHLFR